LQEASTVADTCTAPACTPHGKCPDSALPDAQRPQRTCSMLTPLLPDSEDIWLRDAWLQLAALGSTTARGALGLSCSAWQMSRRKPRIATSLRRHCWGWGLRCMAAMGNTVCWRTAAGSVTIKCTQPQAPSPSRSAAASHTRRTCRARPAGTSSCAAA
jgi:hypothetical protein